MEMKIEQPKLLLQGAVQLHPETCGSSLRWSVLAKQVRNEHKGNVSYSRDLDASVHLTDCSRQITWSSTSYEGGAEIMIEKLDRAIAELRAFRKSVSIAAKFYDKLKHGNEGTD